MRPLLTRFLLGMLVIVTMAAEARAADPITFTNEFNLFTSSNAQGYFKPVFTTIGQSWNSNLHTSADYPRVWSVGLGISAMGMIIPSSQKSFDAELPKSYGNTDITETAHWSDGSIIRNAKGTIEQPTFYGGISTPVFSAPSNNYQPKSAGYAEGSDLSFAPGVPVAQLIVGFPTATQLRLRFLMFDFDGAPTTYIGGIVNQRVDHFFHLFENDPTYALGLSLAFHTMNRDPGLSMTSFAFGAHISKELPDLFDLYGGLQVETLSGEFEAKRNDVNSFDVKDSPFDEVRLGEDVKFDIESFTSFRLYGGLSWKYSFIELHGDIGYASQPFFSVGITFWFTGKH